MGTSARSGEAMAQSSLARPSLASGAQRALGRRCPALYDSFVTEPARKPLVLRMPSCSSCFSCLRSAISVFPRMYLGGTALYAGRMQAGTSH